MPRKWISWPPSPPSPISRTTSTFAARHHADQRQIAALAAAWGGSGLVARSQHAVASPAAALALPSSTPASRCTRICSRAWSRGSTSPARASDDGYGHGTHVAGMVAGNGAVLGTVNMRGMAPGANIVSLKVLDKHGVGKTSDVIAAIEWVGRYGRAYGVRVINLSIGHPVVESYRRDPLNLAVQRAVKARLRGRHLGRQRRPDAKTARSSTGSILSPANDPAVITVGAVDGNGTARRSDDVVADFSSRGPTAVRRVRQARPRWRPAAASRRRRRRPSYLATTFPGASGGGLERAGRVSDAQRNQHGRLDRQRHRRADARRAVPRSTRQSSRRRCSSARSSATTGICSRPAPDR